MLKTALTVLALLLSSPAMAYIGPGAGISVLGSLLGIVVTIVVAIGAIIMWPLRKMLKKKRANAAETGSAKTDTQASDSE